MVVSVPATSANMGPGFDTLGVALGLRNEIRIRPSKFFGVSIHGEGQHILKLKGGNIFITIFNEHYRQLTGRNDTFKFDFFNKIPLSRGLGSSSAVIVSAIFAAYEAAGVGISKDKLLNLALHYESHPDNITPAVMGGFTTAITEGQKVHYVKHAMPSTIQAVVVIPDKAISTNQARAALPKKLSMEEAAYNIGRSSLLTAALITGDYSKLRLASCDKLHQNTRMSRLPELFDIQSIALEEGALMSTLSGSGSTFFNMVYKDDSQRLAGVLKERFPHFKVEILEFDNEGVVLKDEMENIVISKDMVQ